MRKFILLFIIFLLFLPNTVLAEANFDDSCDCSFLISEDITDIAK